MNESVHSHRTSCQLKCWCSFEKRMRMNVTLTSRSWFPLTNSSIIGISVIEIIIALVFISIILSDRRYRTIANCLSINTVVAIMFLALSLLVIGIHIL